MPRRETLVTKCMQRVSWCLPVLLAAALACATSIGSPAGTPIATPAGTQAASPRAAESVAASATQVSAPAASASASGRRVVELVREQFFDRERGAAWAQTHVELAEPAASPEASVERTKRALAELHASHTGCFTPLDPEYDALLAVFAEALGVEAPSHEGIGVDVTAEHFVRVVHAGGPAARAGVRRGDRLLAADGAAFHPVLSFRGRAGQDVVLSVQRHADEAPTSVHVTPRSMPPRQEWIEAQRAGTRLMAHGGRSIGYVPLYSGAGEEFQAMVQDAMAHEFRYADAIILDLRNGWGGCNPDFVTLFEGANRAPLFVLVNGGSRSGKEVLARAIQRQRLGTLVGERTAGAVLGGSCWLLPDGSLLELAVSDVLVDGERLEGVGVAPDVEVIDTLPFADGHDPQLDTALQLAAP